MQRKKKNDGPALSGVEGFSLIEMLVSLGIVMILSGMVLAYNQSSIQKTVLFTEQAKVIGVLNRAKAFALERYKGNSSSYCAFGVKFGPGTTYSILGVRTPSSGSCITGSVLSSSDTIESYALDRRVAFISLPPQGAIFFEAPYLSAVNSGTIVLELVNVSPVIQSSIEVTSGGGISSL